MGTTATPEVAPNTPTSYTATPRSDRARVLGLPVDRVTMSDALAWMADTVEVSRGDARTTSRQIVTLNPEMVVAARGDAALAAAIQAADLVVADGIGVVWATRLLRAPAPERVTGVDLLDAFCATAALRSYRVFLLGAAPGVAAEAARRLAGRHPGLVASAYSGSPADADAPDLLLRIRESRAEAVFVAFGSPVQEIWLARHRGQLGAAVAVGVGGALDFLAGAVPRAPAWIRAAGLEWCYRLWRQPWRWRRMLALPRFALAVAGEAAAVRLGRRVRVGEHRGQH